MEEVEVVARWSFNSNIFLELRFSRLRISPAPATVQDRDAMRGLDPAFSLPQLPLG